MDKNTPNFCIKGKCNLEKKRRNRASGRWDMKRWEEKAALSSAQGSIILQQLRQLENYFVSRERMIPGSTIARLSLVACKSGSRARSCEQRQVFAFASTLGFISVHLASRLSILLPIFSRRFIFLLLCLSELHRTPTAHLPPAPATPHRHSPSGSDFARSITTRRCISSISSFCFVKQQFNQCLVWRWSGSW